MRNAVCKLCRFARCDHGNVLMITGLLFLVIVAVAGAGIDFGRQQLVRLRLQQATDAAAIAAGELPSSATNQERSDIALRYYQLNYPAPYSGLGRPEPRIAISDRIVVEANQVRNTDFIRHVNVTELRSTGRSVVRRATADTAYDVYLVMDNSGSMNSQDAGASYTAPPSDLQAALTKANGYCVPAYQVIFENICATDPRFGAQSDCVNRFAQGLCAGQTASAWGFVGNSRMNALRYAAKDLVRQILEANGDNRVSLIRWHTELIENISPTRDAGLLNTAIDSMFADAATNSELGLQQARQTIESNSSSSHVQVVILLTDGFNSNVHPYGNAIAWTPGSPSSTLLWTNPEYGCDSLNICPEANRRSLLVCDALKQQQVQVYTVAFGQSILGDTVSGSIARDFLRACANDLDHYYAAEDASSLYNALTKIFAQVQTLRIAE